MITFPQWNALCFLLILRFYIGPTKVFALLFVIAMEQILYNSPQKTHSIIQFLLLYGPIKQYLDSLQNMIMFQNYKLSPMLNRRN